LDLIKQLTNVEGLRLTPAVRRELKGHITDFEDEVDIPEPRRPNRVNSQMRIRQLERELEVSRGPSFFTIMGQFAGGLHLETSMSFFHSLFYSQF
jgi:hypothetical protein